MNCLNCRAPLRPGAAFCTRCGAKVTQALCENCQNPLTAGDRFCRICGEKVPERCPQCGAARKAQGAYCIFCGAFFPQEAGGFAAQAAEISELAPDAPPSSAQEAILQPEAQGQEPPAEMPAHQADAPPAESSPAAEKVLVHTGTLTPPAQPDAPEKTPAPSAQQPKEDKKAAFKAQQEKTARKGMIAAAILFGSFLLIVLICFVLISFAIVQLNRAEPEITAAPSCAPTAQSALTQVPALKKTAEPEPTPAPTPRVSQGDRDFYVDTANAKSTTVMLYMIGSDLESGSSLATVDLQEMIAGLQRAQADAPVRVLAQCGGTLNWLNPDLPDRKNTRIEITADGVRSFEEVELKTMLAPGALKEFITFCKKTAPADRYILIFWDHGAGPVYGFGYDEMLPEEVMTLAEIDEGLKNAGVKFDLIAFDSCMMASIEVAQVMEAHADYLLASQDIAAGSGLSYDTLIAELSADPAIQTYLLGKRLIDASAAKADSEETMSLVDLTYIPSLVYKLSSFWSSTAPSLDDAALFDQLVQARRNAQSFSDPSYDLIDLYDFFSSLDDLSHARAIIRNFADVLCYQCENAPIDTHGLSMYFPYVSPEMLPEARSAFDACGYPLTGTDFFEKFLARQSEKSAELFAGLQQENNLLEMTWSDDAGCYLLPLTEQQWAQIDEIQFSLMIDHGEGYFDLGYDNYYEFDEQDRLLMAYDSMWVAINGQTVPFYTRTWVEYGNNWSHTGIVPALLNGTIDIDLVLEWSDECPEGQVLGYYILSENNTASRLHAIKPGDVLQFCCWQYDYSLESQSYEPWGEPILVGEEPLTVSYEGIQYDTVCAFYSLIDIYQNTYITDFIELSR